ncbi:MAG: bacterial transcriptional activator domain-containing protein [Anaerolineae bacterium]|nr:bacterial transcriptional activator domain-containing protein [Anaerolineae bacterium]
MFLDYTKKARIVLLHPHSRYRSILIARVINEPAVKTFYYAMGPDDVNVPSFLSGLTHDLADQYPLFGRHLNQIRYDTITDHKVLIETLVRDLDELSEEPYVLILDEYDRADAADDLQAFIEKLVPALPDKCRMVINSRTLPRLPWVSLIAQKQATVLQDDRLVSSDFYGVEHEGSPRLEVYALGPGYVELDGKQVTTWEGHLPRLLFFFALDRPIVTRAEICQAFWPELDTDQAVNVFHVTKRRLHKALGFDVLVHDGGYYRVNPTVSIHYDIMDFVGALVEGRSREGDEAVAAWQRAVNLYRGPFLQGHSDEWIVSRRTDFRAGYLEALTEMARARQDEGRAEHALGLYLRAIGEDPRREDLHRAVMQLYANLGRRSEAAAHFQKLEEDLKNEYNAEPEAETRVLYDEIMS